LHLADPLPSACPFSGLPIRAQDDWVYRNPNGSYEASFALIGQQIALVIAKGYVEDADMRRAIEMAESIKAIVLPGNTRYVSIENFAQARGATAEARRRYLAYTNRLERLLGTFVFGLPPFFRLSFNLTRRLGLHRHKVQVVADYRAAIRAAMVLTGSEPVRQERVSSQPEPFRTGWPLSLPAAADRRLGPPPPLQPSPADAIYRDHVDYLLEYLGGIDPQKPGIPRRRKLDGGRHAALEPVCAAIELMKTNMDHLVEEQQRTLDVLSRRGRELQRKSAALERQNRDLRQLLQHNTNDSRELEAGVVRNAHEILKPLITAMQHIRASPAQTDCLNRLNRQLDELLDSLAPRLDSPRFNLTAQELRVARLIREGFDTRQIAARFKIGIRTVTTHRMRIRTKLGIKGQRRNLRTCLLAIPDDDYEAKGSA
jgi:DNA-binding CsgD family transcriptional regulator